MTEKITKFTLSSNRYETHDPRFIDAACRLVRTVNLKGNDYYMIETTQPYPGIDFGFGLIAINRFLIRPRRGKKLGEKLPQDVIVYLADEPDTDYTDKNLLSLKIVDWAIISEIIEES